MKKGDSIDSLLPPDSWFHQWLKAWPLSENPRSYNLIAVMSVLGAILGRKVWVDADDRKIYPLLNVLLIGPSGLGKTRAVLLAQEHLYRNLRGVAVPHLEAGKVTPESLWDLLGSERNVILIAEELASVFSRAKYTEDLIPDVTSFLNYLPIQSRRLRKELVTLNEPTLTIIGGSTKEWLQDQLPDTATAGGFLPRFLIVFENYKSQRIPLPKRAISEARKKDLERFREEVTRGFEEIIRTFPEGEMEFRDYAASDELEKWAIFYKPPAGHLQPFAERAVEFIQRLCILIAISRKHSSFDKATVKSAISIWETCMKRLEQVVVPASIEGKRQARILEIVGKETLSIKEICRHMRTQCKSSETVALIDSLCMDGGLVRLENGKVKRA